MSTERACRFDSCGRTATHYFHDAGPFGAGTFYACELHAPGDAHEIPTSTNTDESRDANASLDRSRSFPTNDDSVIDSRDVIEAITELESVTDELTPDERETYSALLRLARQGADYSEDWECGATLVRDSYFVEYARQLADEIGVFQIEHSGTHKGIDVSGRWPFICIDWEWAARELQHDYTAVDLDGVTYWVR